MVGIIGMSTEGLARLKLLQLVSPALPVGAYAYSQGLEYAVECGWIDSATSTAAWVEGVLAEGLAHLELPILLRLYRALQLSDCEGVQYWNDYLLASRETRELLLEDTQLGAALRRLLMQLDIATLPLLEGMTELSFCTAFALAGAEAGIDERALLEGFAYSWLENQVQAATKIVPLGQTAGQKLIVAAMPVIITAVERALSLDDEAVGSSLTGVAMASSWHESQYSRLFRS
ncbi:urease accessory protein UreF [Sinobacterium caligoides]